MKTDSPPKRAYQYGYNATTKGYMMTTKEDECAVRAMT